MDYWSSHAARHTGVVLLTIALIASAATAGATVLGSDAGTAGPDVVDGTAGSAAGGDVVGLRAGSADDGTDNDSDNETDEGAEPAGDLDGAQLNHRGGEESGEVDVVEELDTTLSLSLNGTTLGSQMAIFPDGDYAIAGTFQGGDATYVARVSPEGSVEWTVPIDVNTPRGIETTDGGDVVVIGNPDGENPHLFRLSGDGDVVYRRMAFPDLEVYGLAVTDDIYVSGSSSGQYFVGRHALDNGSLQDAYVPGNDGTLNDVVVNGPDVYAVGEAGETALAVRLVEIEGELSEDWRKRFGSDDPGSEDFDHLAFSPASDNVADLIALGGANESEDGREQDIYMARLDPASDGEAVWIDRFGSPAQDLPWDVVRVGGRVVALTYPGWFNDDDRTAKAYLVDERDGSRRIVANGANDGDVFLAGVGTDGNRLVITGGESRDQDPDREFEDLGTMLLRYRFVEAEPTVRIRDATLDPSTVEDDSTVTHSLRLGVGGVSDDGNTDTFAVEFRGVDSISPNSVSVEDAEGNTIPVTSAESAGNTYFFSVSPDSGAETRTLTATVSVDATYPDVDRNTSTEVWAGVDDSAHGNDSVGIGLTISDVPSGSDCPTVGGSDAPATDPDDDGLCEDVNGDGATTSADATVLFNAVFDGEIPSDDTRFDIDGDGSTRPGDATVLFNQVFGSDAPPATEGAPKVLIPEPTSQSVAPGESVTYEIAIGDIAGGVGGYDVAVSVADPSTATITDATNEIGGQGRVEIADDGSSVRIGAFAGDTVDTGSAVTIATVTVTGENAGETTLSIDPTSVSDESGVDRYRIGDTSDATVTVDQSGGDVPIQVAVYSVDGGELPLSNTTGNPVLAGDVTNRLRFEVFPAPNTGPLDEPVTLALSGPTAEAEAVTRTADVDTLPGTDLVTPGRTDGHVGFLQVTPTGTGTSVIAVHRGNASGPVVATIDGGDAVFDVLRSNRKLDVEHPSTVTVGDTLSVTVTDSATGDPVEAATVVATGPDGDSVTVQTAANGDALLDVDAAGTYELTVRRAGYETASSTFEATEPGTGGSDCPTVDGTRTADPDSDGLCEDFNGNGRLDFDDVNRFFENVSDSEVENNVAAFDFNGNDRIDFDDVNTLFDEVS